MKLNMKEKGIEQKLLKFRAGKLAEVNFAMHGKAYRINAELVQQEEK